MKRMTVLVEDRTYEKLKRRAKVAGGTVSDEVRAILSEKLDEQPNNDWFLQLARIGEKYLPEGGALDLEKMDESIGDWLEEDYRKAMESYDAEVRARR